MAGPPVRIIELAYSATAQGHAQFGGAIARALGGGAALLQDDSLPSIDAFRRAHASQRA